MLSPQTTKLSGKPKPRLHNAKQNERQKSAEFIRELIKVGAEVTTKDHQGRTPLHLAAAQMFLPTGGDHLEALGQKLNKPFLLKSYWEFSSSDGKESLVATDILLELGSDVNAADDDGNTPLHLLMGDYLTGSDDREEKAKAIAASLIKKGARINSLNRKGQTPLDFFFIDPNRRLTIDVIAPRLQWLRQLGAKLAQKLR